MTSVSDLHTSLPGTSPSEKWGAAQHLLGQEISVKRSNGAIDSGWQLNEYRPGLVPLRDIHTDEPIGDGVWCYRIMTSEYTMHKCCLIAELLELNPLI
jgi:hypothetical protein